jgi:NAD+ synthase
MADALHITLAQINPVVGDLAGNLDRIRAAIADAPARTDLIVFPELALCGYPAEDLILKPAFLADVKKTLRRLAADSRAWPAALLVGAPERRNGKTFNCVHLIAEGRIVKTIRKRNLPNYGVFDEARVFIPGPLPRAVPFKGHRLGIMVCEDMWSPACAASLKKSGAEILIVPNASPFDSRKREIRLAQARARVAETGLPLVYVNQAGGQDDLVFDGGSFVLSEAGNVIVQAGEFAEERHDTVWEKNAGGHWICTTDIKIDSYGEEELVYQALVTGLRDYVLKSGFSGVLLGLSGGIDSALVAALAADALGADAVHAVMLPSRFTAQESLDDAAALAAALGIHLDHLPIHEPVQALEHGLRGLLPPNAPGVTHENLQSRCRGVLLMALSNASGRLLLTTGNKSEMAAGYATLYGDMCGGFNPLKDVYKTLVYRLARWRNGARPRHALGPAGAVIPENILTRAPTAELRPGQTDQDSLPPYDTLDAILACLIEKDMGIKEIIAEGFERKTVRQVARLLEISEYKRRQSAPGPKVTPRAFGRERRYPIVNGYKG